MKTISLIFAFALFSVSCRNAADKAETFTESESLVRQEAIDSMKIEMAKQEAEMARQKSIDSVQNFMAVQAAKRKPETKTVVVHQNSQASAPVAEKKKKGWSNTAKGAVIGAGVGGVAGAVINKKDPAKGAVIGVLAGGAVGAGTGAILDAQKKKREQQ